MYCYILPYQRAQVQYAEGRCAWTFHKKYSHKNTCVFPEIMLIIQQSKLQCFSKEGAMYNPAIADMVSMAGRVQRDTLGAQIITKTLDYMNSTGVSGLGYGSSVGISNNADYHFQTSVLNAVYSGRGTFVDMIS